MTVGEFKAQFSKVVELVKEGQVVEVTFGRGKKVIGYFKAEKKRKKVRKLGLLEDTKGYKMADNFNETSDEEFTLN